MSVTLVIARYNENMDWLNHFLNDSKYTIICYNKGSELLNLSEKISQIRLPNVGREAHTYLYHILTNYDNLTDYTVFVQGNPFDHIQSNVYVLKSMIDTHVNSLSKELYYLAYRKEYERIHFYKELHIENYMKYFNLGIMDRVVFSPGAQYVVHRDNIKNKWNMYKEMYTYLGNDHNNRHPRYGPFQVEKMTAYTMERLWPYVFG